MKRIILSYIILICSAGIIFGQVDRSQPPKPGKAKKLELGNYETYTLDNGLTVILVENHKLPQVSFSLQLDFDPILEGDKSGTASMAGSLLRSGSSTRTKEQIDKEIDFIGASLNTSAGGLYGSCLKKHQNTLLELMTDVLYNPTFPMEEFDKQKKQILSALSFNSTDANTIASTVSQVLCYGLDHPYGEPVTEETVDNITLDGVKSFYNTYFRPNQAYLIMVGDLSLEESKSLASQFFSQWESGDVPEHLYEDPKSIKGTRVAFAEKPGAVQSVITIVHPVYLKPGDPDAIPVTLMNTILGGGVFSGRLMMNLREDKAYTYGATSSVSTDKLVGQFQAGAQVGNEVTDSALTEFFYEIRRMRDQLVSDDDLRMNKDVMMGQFARSLESPQTVASFALNSIRYKLPADYYSGYLEKLEKVTAEDIQQMAQKYLHPDNCFVIVVGNKSEVAEKLNPFAASNEVEFYDRYGIRVEQTDQTIPEGMEAGKVIDKYIGAIGGKEAMLSIKQITRVAKGMVDAMGQQVELDINTWMVAPNLVSLEMKMGDMLLNKQVYDGKVSFIAGMQGNQDVTGDDLERMKYDSYIFPELFYNHLPYQVSLEGIEKLNGEDVYVINVTNPAGSKQKEYFSIDSGLKVRVVTSQETPQGPMETIIDYQKYQVSGGVLFPFEITQQAGPQKIELKVLSIDTESEVSGAVFKK